MSKEHEHEWLRVRLDAIIQLMLESTDGAPKSAAGKIEKLMALGFKQPEVARIIGKAPNFVSATIANSKKKGAPKAAKKSAAKPDSDSGDESAGAI